MIFRTWMNLPMRCAAKFGFFSRTVWENVLEKNMSSWNYEQWKMLKDTGLFEHSPRFVMSPRLLVLTAKGWKFAVNELGLDPVSVPGGDSIKHDENLMEIVLRLEKANLIESWCSELECKRDNYTYVRDSSGQSKQAKFPDLIIKLKVPGAPVFMALELEKTRKTKSRYDDFVNKYKGKPNIDSVIVICETEGIKENIKRSQEKNNYPQRVRPMVFAMRDEFLKNPGEGKLDYNGQTTSIQAAVHKLRAERTSTDNEKAS